MIELRWVDRRIPSERMRPETNIWPEWPRERVLQYRTRDMNAIGMLPGPWSDWRDVPTAMSAAIDSRNQERT